MSDNTETDNPDYDSYDILQGFNATEHMFVQPLLSLMMADPKTLTWDKHTGEIVFKNRRVKDSNVTELLKNSITDNLYPAGKMEFYRGLVDLNVKSRYIKHPKNKVLVTAFMNNDKKLVCKKKVKKV